jgi:hypothetical protein
MLKIPSYRYARWLGATGLLVTILVACGVQDPQTINYDAYYRGTWELTSISDTTVEDYAPRTPTAEEARTWHVFSSEDAANFDDTVRAPVTVEWAGSSGSGYWYFCCSSTVRVEVTLTRPGGGTEVYAADLLYGGSGMQTLSLYDSHNHGHIENYRRVGEP